VLAVDPSLNSTGYAIVDKAYGDVIDLGRILTPIKIPIPERLKYIYISIVEIISNYSPQINVLAIEDQYMFKNADTLKKLSQVRGVIELAGAMSDIQFFVYTPAQIKKTMTNNGNADKDAVYQAVRNFYSYHKNVIKYLYSPHVMTNGKNKNDDVSDALAIARTHRVMQSYLNKDGCD